MPKALKLALKAAQVGEAFANYSLADAPLYEPVKKGASRATGRLLRKDGDFWSSMLSDTNNKQHNYYFDCAAISEWVARVPGLYWLPGSERMRRANPAQIESETSKWQTFTPPLKSVQVAGGVGTLKLGPSEQGYRLVTLTANYNASSGIPALVSPEVWDDHTLAEGTLVYGEARWRDMPPAWATKFPVIQNIPRGCLVFDRPGKLKIIERRVPILAHPFTIMEYWDGNALLHDFVYATGDTSERGFRKEIAGFFRDYQKAKGREGTYFTSADTSRPMWDATFSSPEDMRQRKAEELRLIEHRIEDTMKGKNTIESLIRTLSRVADVRELKHLSASIEIDWRQWSQGGAIAAEVTRLVDKAVTKQKLPALLHAAQYHLAL